MFMQLRLFAILLFISCFVVEFPDQLIAGGVNANRDKCVPEEGLVRIGITMPGKSWFYEWSAAGLNLTEKRKEDFSPGVIASPGGVYAGRWEEKVAGIPQDFLGADLRLDAPFSVSPEGESLVASVYPAHGEFRLSSSPKLALIDRKNKRLIRTFDARYDVQSVTWSPSGKYFAILLERDVTKQVWKGPLDWFANFLGHPISYYTLYAAIFDLQGNLLCQKRLNEKLRYGSGYLVWEAIKK